MKMRFLKKFSSSLLCLVLIAAMALSFTGCVEEIEETTAAKQELASGSVIGEGSKSFSFTIVNPDGSKMELTVRSDKETVGEALLEYGLIAGENSAEYGLYVKTVNGVTVDYEKDGKYWAFYVNDELSMTGVDQTEIVEGTSYAFKAE